MASAWRDPISFVGVRHEDTAQRPTVTEDGDVRFSERETYLYLALAQSGSLDRVRRELLVKG